MACRVGRAVAHRCQFSSVQSSHTLPGYNLTSKRLEPNVLSKNCAAVLNQLDVKAHKEAHGKVASNATPTSPHRPPILYLWCQCRHLLHTPTTRARLCTHKYNLSLAMQAVSRARAQRGIPTGAQVYTPPEAAYHGAYHGAYASPQGGSVQP